MWPKEGLGRLPEGWPLSRVNKAWLICPRWQECFSTPYHHHRAPPPASRDSPFFLASEHGSHVGAWQWEWAVFIVLKIWPYPTSVGKVFSAELTYRANCKGHGCLPSLWSPAPFVRTVNTSQEPPTIHIEGFSYLMEPFLTSHLPLSLFWNGFTVVQVCPSHHVPPWLDGHSQALFARVYKTI